MRILQAQTEDEIKTERTSLAENATAGSNVSLTLENNNGIEINTFIVVGKEGSENVEIQKVNAAVTPGQTVQVATLRFTHKKGEIVTVYRYDKRKFYGSLTKTGTYAELTTDGSPVTIQVDDPQGTTLEYTGVEGYEYFKATYFNSETDEETDITESDAVLADEDSRYASLYGIRKMSGFTENPYITDGRIEDKRRQAENEINSMISVRYVLPLSTIPPIITYVCELLAAGYIHYEEFGSDGEGGKKLGEARAILKSIKEGTQRLLDADYAELEKVESAMKLSGTPNGSETGGNKIKFTMAKKF